MSEDCLGDSGLVLRQCSVWEGEDKEGSLGGGFHFMKWEMGWKRGLARLFLWTSGG